MWIPFWFTMSIETAKPSHKDVRLAKLSLTSGTWINKLNTDTVYPKKYAHGFCFAVLCCGYTLTDFPISIRLTSLALWQSNDCPSASKATLMNMGEHFMWIHYERLHNHNKAKHNKTVCIFLGIYCTCIESWWHSLHRLFYMYIVPKKYAPSKPMSFAYFRTISPPKMMLWANEISRDSGWRWVSADLPK